MIHSTNRATEFYFSAFDSFPTESEGSDLDEPNRFSHHISDGDLLFQGQVVDEARREIHEHDHVTRLRLLVFDPQILPRICATFPPNVGGPGK